MMLPHLLIPLPLEHMGRSIWRVSGPIVDLRGSSDPSLFSCHLVQLACECPVSYRLRDLWKDFRNGQLHSHLNSGLIGYLGLSWA